MTLIDLLFLYIAFRMKHFVCDFLLQTNWMATKKGDPGIKGYKALFSHCSIHAVGTALIALIFSPTLIWLAAVDFAIHSIIDRGRAILGNKKKWTCSDKAFWVSLGIDQEFHNATHLILIIIIYTHSHGALF